MPTFPSEFQCVILPYLHLFSRRVFAHVQLLVLGALLAPGKRTVTAALRIVGLGQQPGWHKYHRVLSRAKWSARTARRVLLGQVVDALLPAGPLVLGLDETLERRWGPRITARGLYGDAVRGSEAQVVKSSGLRWLSRCLLAPLPWAARVWALPVLTVLAPCAGWAQARGRRHKKVTDGARQAVKQLARWLPGRPLICVGDSGYAVRDLLAATAPYAPWLTRLRLDAALYEPAPARQPGQRGRPRVQGARLPGLPHLAADAATTWPPLRLPADARGQPRPVERATGTGRWYSAGTGVPTRWVLVRPAGDAAGTLSAFLSTNLAREAALIVTTYAQRGALEVTFAQGRAPLGVETQRQWTDLAIAGTTPVLLGLFSLVPLLAARLPRQGRVRPPACAWYEKAAPTCSDARAAGRRYLWTETILDKSSDKAILLKIPRHQLPIWHEALAWPA